MKISFNRYGKRRPCKCQKTRKHKPYGQLTGSGICKACDVGQTVKVSKKTVRNNSEKDIAKQISEDSLSD